MRIGVDLDGVAYDFDGALKHHLITNRGYQADRLGAAERWEFYEDWGMTLDEFLMEANRGVDAGIVFSHGNAFPGVREALQRLIDAGHSLHVVTDRTFGRPGAAEAATAAWVKAELPPISSLTFAADKTLVRTDFMIEDKLANYDSLVEAGTFAYLVNRPWNQVPGDERHRVDTVDEFVDNILIATAVARG